MHHTVHSLLHTKPLCNRYCTQCTTLSSLSATMHHTIHSMHHTVFSILHYAPHYTYHMQLCTTLSTLSATMHLPLHTKPLCSTLCTPYASHCKLYLSLCTQCTSPDAMHNARHLPTMLCTPTRAQTVLCFALLESN